MNKDKEVTDRLLQALTSNEKDFGKILLGEKSTNNGIEYENPLNRAFVTHFAHVENKESLHALALIAILYLSVLHCNFPTHFFRASVNYLRDNISLPTFNCNHYDNIYKNISNEDNLEMPLFKNLNIFAKINLTKNQIFDSFDFLSNGL